MEVSLGLGWLARLLCILGIVFGSGREPMFIRVCSWGLFPGCMVGGLAAWILGGLLRLCLSRVAGWGSIVSAVVGCLGFACRQGGWCFFPVYSPLLP